MIEKAQIPKEFQPDFLQRFDVRNAVVIESPTVEIDVPCSLCVRYFDLDSWRCLEECPFSKFGTKFQRGCTNYLDDMIGGRCRGFVHLAHGRIYWHEKNSEKAKKILQKINEAMNNPKLVEWVD